MKRFCTFSLFIIIFSSVVLCTNEHRPLKILIGSPVRKSPEIVKEFLSSLQQLHHVSHIVDYYFIDDNSDTASSGLLQQFAQQQKTSQCYILSVNSPQTMTGKNEEETHYWPIELIWKVAAFKNCIIKKAIEENYDYLFLVDADLVLNPLSLECLISCNKDIVSEIFWTRWTPQSEELPQVWVSDFYTLNQDFIKQLKQPGVYEVGGLGACTLISKRALQCGVNFNEIKNLTMKGEDRHFCIRALVLGFSLFVDTHFPAYHMYRESELAGVKDFKTKNNLR